MSANSQANRGPTFLPVRQQEVSEEEAGMRLDRFLRDHLGSLPLSLIQRLIRTGQVRINGGRGRGGVRLNAGDTVRLPPVRAEPPKERGKAPLKLARTVQNQILWQDDFALVLNKPAAMAVHGGSGQPWGAVDAVRQLLAMEKNGATPELCHRLDKETSGCLLFGLNKTAVRRLAEAFRQGTVEKEYLALVQGRIPSKQGVINQPLVKGVHTSGERMITTQEGGQAAQTRYRVEKRFSNATLVAAFPDSGRTHQIRVHFQWLGHPLAGDRKYGDRDFNRTMKNLGLTRMFLHAQKLTFPHPKTAQPIPVTAPLDTVLSQTLARLEKGDFR